MNFESLANELFLDLFDYLNGTDLLHAFYGLNFRFNYLLYKQYRNFRFNFKSISKRKFDMICQQHLLFIADRVTTLTLSDGNDTPQQLDLFFSYIPSIDQFTHLRSLSLYQVRTYTTIMKIIDQCHHLCHFTYLKLDSCNLFTDQIERQSIADNIWSLPKLIHCETDIASNIFEKDYRTPTMISSSLKSLFLRREELDFNQINQLFEYTPRLKHLSTGVYHYHNDYRPRLLPTLTNFNIRVFYEPGISKIICLLQNMPNLYRLDVHLSSRTIDGYQWEQLISTHLTKLEIFHLEMTGHLRSNELLENRINELINPFRSSFWVNEHRWFVRCFACERTVYLYTSSDKLPSRQKKFPDLFLSTHPDDDLQNFCNDIITIDEKTFFDHPIPSYVHLTSIKDLNIKFPINDQFWTIVPNLNGLHLLTVHTNASISQSQLQALLDRAPHLYKLNIYDEVLLSFQPSRRLRMGLLQCTNASVRYLDIDRFGFYFNEEECVTLTHSLLAVQCEVLSISVSSYESILSLVYDMNNLRELTVRYTGIVESNRLPLGESVSQHRNKNVLDVDGIIEWLKERLSSTCSISRVSKFSNDIKIWIQ